MENFSYSYPDSGNSSPRSRDIEFENPPPWEDQQQQQQQHQLPQSFKAKFMCSYGGKIQPRQHDNQLSYVGGETKILAVDRNIKFSTMVSKLSALCDADVTFKYQLPGEDLDALISVTNDDDLEHMMHEYDRLYRASAKPARMRLFLFLVNSNPSQGSFGSDRDRFVEALNSGPAAAVSDPVKDAPPSAAAVAAANKVDFLFGLEKGVPLPTQSPPVPPVKYEQVQEPLPQVSLPEAQVRGVSGSGDRIMGSDQVEIQRQLQELQRLQISEHHDQGMYRRKSDDFLTGGGAGGYVGGGGDFYMAQLPCDKIPPAMNLPPPSSVQQQSANFWPEKQVPSGGFPQATMTAAPGGQERPMYMIPGPTPGTFYQAAQVMRPVTGPTSQVFYTVQRMGSDVYREQPVYGTVSQPQPQPPLQASLPTAASTILPPPQPMKVPAYSEGFGMVRPSGVAMDCASGVAMDSASGYAQVAYDSAVGKQVYYTAQGGLVHAPPYQAAVPGELARPGGVSIGQEVKMVNKNSPGSM